MIVPLEESVLSIATAALVDDADDVLKAWAERHIRRDSDIKWMLGNYVEADNANSNGHIFPLTDLLVAQKTLAGKPLNMMHREHYIVGAFAGGQLVDETGAEWSGPEGAVQVDARDSVRMEALAGLWHNRFPEEMFNITRAHKDGNLFYSMEAIPGEVGCPTCNLRVPYAGSDSDTYCAEMRGPVGPKILYGSNFCGGAVIIPPVKPGWSRADITTISKLVRERPDEAEAIQAGFAAQAPHLSLEQWEQAMAMVMLSTSRIR